MVQAVVGALQYISTLLWWLWCLLLFFLKELLGDSGKLLVLPVCERAKLGFLEEWELWCETTGHWVVASYVCIILPLNLSLYNMSGSFRGTEDRNLKVENSLHFFSASCKFVYWPNSQTSQQVGRPKGTGCLARLCFLWWGAPMTLLVWPFSQRIKTRCPGFQTGFCHVNNTSLLTHEPGCIGFRDLCPQLMVKVLSHDRTVIASFLGWNLEVHLSFALYMKRGDVFWQESDLGL